jgi:hypothetical protein
MRNSRLMTSSLVVDTPTSYPNVILPHKPPTLFCSFSVVLKNKWCVGNLLDIPSNDESKTFFLSPTPGLIME